MSKHVKVKPLEWVDTGQTGFLKARYYAVAGSLRHPCHPVEGIKEPFFEHYTIRWVDYDHAWKAAYWVGSSGLSGLNACFDTVEEAKAAAQADYEPASSPP